MNVIGKLGLLVQRREEFNKSLDERSQVILDHYAAADKKADEVFARHDARPNEEEKAIIEVESVIELMSNQGNLPSSGESGGKD